MDIQLLPTDKKFTDSPDIGKDCICSRCGKPIEKGMPLRLWPEDIKNNPESNYEYRFHGSCVGIPDLDKEEDEEEIFNPYDQF